MNKSHFQDLDGVNPLKETVADSAPVVFSGQPSEYSLANSVESNEELGKTIAQQLSELNPVLEKDELQRVIGSGPILAVHPHLPESSTRDPLHEQDDAATDQRQNEIALLKEQLAELIAQKAVLHSMESEESKEDMGREIANQLTEISPVFEKDELEQIIGSQPILVLHPHLNEETSNENVKTDEQSAKVDHLLEKLARLVAEKPELIPNIPATSTFTASANTPDLSLQHPAPNPTENMNEISRIIAEELADMNPIIEKDDLEKAIGSLPVLVLQPSTGIGDKMDQSPGNVKKDDTTPMNQEATQDRPDGDDGFFDYQVPEHRHVDTDLVNAKETKEGVHRNHAHALENQDEVTRNEVFEHKSHKHIDESLENPSELYREQQRGHVHMSEDLDNAEELIEEEHRNRDHGMNKIFDNTNEQAADNDTHQTHMHLENNLEDPEELIKEQKQEHRHISKGDLENFDETAIKRKQFHKHIDKNVEEFASKERQDHKHIAEDLENDNELIAEKLSGHDRKNLNVDDMPENAGMIDRSLMKGVVLEKSSDTIYGVELTSTPTTITLLFHILRDSAFTAAQ